MTTTQQIETTEIATRITAAGGECETWHDGERTQGFVSQGTAEASAIEALARELANALGQPVALADASGVETEIDCDGRANAGDV